MRLPARDRDARRIAAGALCCDNDFGCYRSDDEDLATALAAATTPDARGWFRYSRTAWRWYGTHADGTRSYVEVRRGD